MGHILDKPFQLIHAVATWSMRVCISDQLNNIVIVGLVRFVFAYCGTELVKHQSLHWFNIPFLSEHVKSSIAQKHRSVVFG